MPFYLKEAFMPLNGQSFTVRELEDRLATLRVEWRKQLPAEIGVRELFDMLHVNRWLVEEDDGKVSRLRVKIK